MNFYRNDIRFTHNTSDDSRLAVMTVRIFSVAHPQRGPMMTVNKMLMNEYFNHFFSLLIGWYTVVVTSSACYYHDVTVLTK